jgi:hypothetical protein
MTAQAHPAFQRLQSLPSVRSPAAPATWSDDSWQIRLLYVAGLLITLPVIALARLLPVHRPAALRESVFGEANRSVLTALGTAFMA